VLSNWSLSAAAFGILVTLGAVGRMLCEERLVVELYPEYREYARSTKRMVPGAF
jgi:protein-S-isoprenylcysteine O-methyltransferase Ste14